MDKLDETSKKILTGMSARRAEFEKENLEIASTKGLTKVTSAFPEQVIDQKQIKSPLRNIYRAKFAACAADDEQFVFEPTRKSSKEKEEALKPVNRFGTTKSANAIEFFVPKCYYLPLRSSSESNAQRCVTKDNQIEQGNTDTISSSSIKETQYVMRTEKFEEFYVESVADPSNSAEYGLHTFLKKKPTQPKPLSTVYEKFATNDTTSKLRLYNAIKASNNHSSDKQFTKREVLAEVKPRLAPFHVLWHGSPTTPVVKGTDPKEPIKPAYPATDMKKLRSRWEFSSTTGTPLHPDATEDELLKAAKHISEQSVPSKRKPEVVNKPLSSQTFDYKPSNDYLSQLSSCRRLKENERPYSTYHTQASSTHGYGGHTLEDGVYDYIGSSTKSKGMADEITAVDTAFDFIYTPRQESVAIPAEDFPKSPSNVSLAPSTLRVTGETSDSMEKPAFEQQSLPDSPATTSNSIHSNGETSTTDSEAALAHSLSFYRRLRGAKEGNNIQTIVCAGVQTPMMQPKGIHVGSRRDQDKRAEVQAKLKQAIAIEDQRIAQASTALMYCRQSRVFAGSREEVDAQRALLISKETRKVLAEELERTGEAQSRDCDLPRGVLQISQIKLFFSPDFLKGYANYFRDIDIVYYFIILIKCESTLLHTALMSTDNGIQDGSIDFNQYLQIENIHPDFNCHLEVYALRSTKEPSAYEQKRAKSGSVKSLNVFSTKAAKSPKRTQFNNNRILDPRFYLVGSLDLNIDTVDDRKFYLAESQHPLLGELHMKVKKFPLGKGDISHRGFLSVYQKAQGLASWTRYWCTIENGELKFWREPEDENTKDWVLLIDLSTCSKDGAVVEAHGTFPHSFHIDIWVPKDEPGRDLEKLRVLMAADHKEMLAEWTYSLNKAIRYLLIWSNSKND